MIKQTIWNNQTTYYLSNDDISIWLNPSDGMNLYEILYQGKPLIKFYEDRLIEDKTCSVMTLFPTPNRIRDGVFVFDGTKYHGKNHGIVKHATFQVNNLLESLQGGTIEATLTILPEDNNVYYKALPFACTLTLRITLDGTTITYDYSVCNLDNKILPYGIAIHPFFEKQDEDVSIQVFADSYMENDSHRLPTGIIMKAIGEFDLTKPTSVNSLHLDHVYTNIRNQPCALIHYSDKTVSLQTSEEFKKLVVYTPENSPFFCLENQTCSTDAINLYHKGFVEESSLICLKPKEQKEGRIQIEILPKDC
ncbi:MAG TPA: hypothetical protein DHW61_06585 [Lachnoclostridium phytofermentans]|uniref:Aldose 1-epimerase n=1 Tax=Lachnoclostridium phytofermentans TaxID=66219 RepID=A0A3D2X4N8_9FIRM|nr:aldose 1-epimerase [Lachnoclostridium sp.]HCL02072.1 hypothetical protein [Lachnoclostridium phytofermentans]